MQNTATANWFIPQLEDFQSQRALLNLRLGKAVRFYRELIVPGIGGVWFVRQLSWGVAGIRLGQQAHLKPTRVANGIEALACKLEWEENRKQYNKRGKRAFERDEDDDVWSFKSLSDRMHYVQVTYRQSTVRGLSGLGFATGTRYNTMDLTLIGDDLCDVFLETSGSRIVNELLAWLNGESICKTRRMANGIGSLGSNNEEKKITRERLCAASCDRLGDPQRRGMLIEAFGANRTNMPHIGSLKRQLPEDYVNDINTSIAFDQMLSCGRSVIHKCAQLIADKQRPVVATLAQNKTLRLALEEATEAANKFQRMKGKKQCDAISYASELLSPSISNARRLSNIILRDGHILDCSGDRVTEGHLFDRRKELNGSAFAADEDVGQEESSTENKIKQLFKLWGDCR